jgi:hypothetical protein
VGLKIYFIALSWIWILIRIKVISWIRIRINLQIRIKVISWFRIRINLQMMSQNVRNRSLFEHFSKVLSLYLEARYDPDPQQCER